MSRDITSAMATASAAELFRPFTAVELNFSTGRLRFNSTDRTLTFNADGGSPSDDFLGVGQYGSMSVVEESSELKNYSIDLQLRGIPNDLISSALGADYQGRPCKVWFGLMEADFAVIADPTLWFDGLMDTMNIQLGQEATVTLRAQSRLARWEEAQNVRYTNEEQQRRFPADKGLEFVAQMVEKEIVWRIA